jgi:hypothetical protein
VPTQERKENWKTILNDMEYHEKALWDPVNFMSGFFTDCKEVTIKDSK